MPTKPTGKKPVAKTAIEDTQETKKTGGGKKGLLIGVVIILLLINGAQFFLSQKEKEEHVKEITGKDTDISKYLDEINAIQEKLEEQKAIVLSLGGEITELDVQIASLEEAKEKLRKNNNWNYSQKKRLEKELAGHKMILNLRDDKIKSLEEQVAILDSTSKEQKVVIQTKLDEISNLESIKEDLSDKVKEAQVLTAGSFVFQPYKKKDKVIKPLQPFKGKSIAKLNISFTLMPNAVAMVETKSVYLQVLDNRGSVINVEQSGTFETEEGAEIFYTLTSDEMYQREGTKVSFSFVNSSEYLPGTYTTNVYVEGELIGSENFDIK